jgi:hypothetical protein
VAELPCHTDLYDSTEFGVGEDAEIEEKDGEFCEVLDHDIEYLSDVEELLVVSGRYIGFNS